MFGSSTNTPPYTTPLTSVEFVNSEVEKDLSHGSISIKQTISQQDPFYKGRTAEINGSIACAFRAIANNIKSEWSLYNGSDVYEIANIKEHKLMKKLIVGAPSERKDFYALEIGAGNYQWGRELAHYLNSKKDIPKDVTIHIIGIRGETNLDKKVTELGQCKLYEFGQFQVERLMDEFKKEGLELANKVDLVISSWCFRHLVDPVGTFTQAYDLLRPKTGHLLMHGFFFLHENEKKDDQSMNFDERMIRLYLETKAPFLTLGYNRHDIGQFVMNKPDDRPCYFNKQYLGREEAPEEWRIGSGIVTRFKEIKDNNTEVAPLLWKGQYRGDKGLYERLRQNGLLSKSDQEWGPLQEKDANKNTTPLHIAIAKGDEKTIAQCLIEGCDINESDNTGATPLHLAIKHNNYKLFSTLLEKGALTKLFADKRAPLHLAVEHDFNGHFVEDLIKSGGNINISAGEYIGSSPLDWAIKYKNVKAVELLLEAKAIVNYENRKSIENNSIFSSIQRLLPKKLSELEGFDTIINHIQKGNCVIVSYPDGFRSKQFQKTTQDGEESKLIIVTVNPETRLLNDLNYIEIEDLTDCRAQPNYMEDMVDITPDVELRFGY